MPSRYCCLTTASASPAVCTSMISRSGRGHQIDDALPLDCSGQTTSKFLHAFLRGLLDGGEGFDQRIFGDGFFEIGHGAERESAAAIFIAGDDVNRNVAGGGIVLQAIENGPARDIGKSDVQGDRAGLELARQRHGAAAAQGHQRFQVVVVSEVDQDSGEGDVVFDDEQDRVARLDQVAIVVEDQIFGQLLVFQAGKKESVDLGPSGALAACDPTGPE